MMPPRNRHDTITTTRASVPALQARQLQFALHKVGPDNRLCPHPLGKTNNTAPHVAQCEVVSVELPSLAAMCFGMYEVATASQQ